MTPVILMMLFGGAALVAAAVTVGKKSAIDDAIDISEGRVPSENIAKAIIAARAKFKPVADVAMTKLQRNVILVPLEAALPEPTVFQLREMIGVVALGRSVSGEWPSAALARAQYETDLNVLWDFLWVAAADGWHINPEITGVPVKQRAEDVAMIFHVMIAHDLVRSEPLSKLARSYRIFQDHMRGFQRQKDLAFAGYLATLQGDAANCHVTLGVDDPRCAADREASVPVLAGYLFGLLGGAGLTWNLKQFIEDKLGSGWYDMSAGSVILRAVTVVAAAFD